MAYPSLDLLLLGMQVVAEGVKCRERQLRLAALGCEFMQGYLFSEPLSAAVAETLC